MDIHAILPPKGRDLRLDLFRGIANWAIFLDHIPDNVVNWITTRNYGFSDAADLFVFISGYTASFVYAKMMLERGFIVGATRLFKRVWQLYVAHVILFVIYIAAIGYVAQRYNDPDIINEFNVAGLVDNPIQTLTQGLLLKFKPLNLDVLPLYIVLMGFFPPVLWMMLRKPDLTMLASLALYFAARQFGWNLAAYPSGTWYFNPFTWQLLFVFGAWFALGGAVGSRSVIKSKRAAVFRSRLSRVLADHDHGRPVSGLWPHDAGLAVRRLQSQRQDQPRTLPRAAFRHHRLLRDTLRLEGMARPAVEDL
ncbi:hypothetical protein V1284_000448 [Nitrobacteraceae bacterium AZCC 2299]